MRVSSKTIYAVRALFDITYHNLGKPTKVDAIAERELVPPRFLEQIFQELKAASIVGSKRGPNGGYFMLQNPEAVSLLDVLKAIEGEPALASCESGEPGSAEAASTDVTNGVWSEVLHSLSSVFEKVTLADICLRATQAGVERGSNEEFFYVI